MRSPVLWGLLAALLIGCGGGAVPAAAAPVLSSLAPPRTMTETEFRDALKRAVEERLPAAKVTVSGPEELKVTGLPGLDGEGLVVFVGNVYARYLNNLGDGSQIIADFADVIAKSALSAGQKQVAEPERFIVLVRPIDYLTVPGIEKTRVVSKPLSKDLIVVMAIDEGKGFRMAAVEDIAATFDGKSDAAWARAMANTADQMGDIEVDPIGEGLWTVTGDANLTDSLMVLPPRWGALGVALKGAPVVVAYKRNVLLVADAGVPGSVEALRRLLERKKDDQEVMSVEILIWRNGAWRPYTP